MIPTRRVRLFLIALLTTSGVMHFVRPTPFLDRPGLPKAAELGTGQQWLRLPLEIPLVVWSLRVGRASSRAPTFPAARPG